MENVNSNKYRNDEFYGSRNENIASSISYLSVFAPVLLPIVMWIIATNLSIHARKALFNHILTWVCFYISAISIDAIC